MENINFAQYVLCINFTHVMKPVHDTNSEPGVTVVKHMKRQTDPYGKAMKKWTKEWNKSIYLNKLPNISVWKQTFFRG